MQLRSSEILSVPEVLTIIKKFEKRPFEPYQKAPKPFFDSSSRAIYDDYGIRRSKISFKMKQFRTMVFHKLYRFPAFNNFHLDDVSTYGLIWYIYNANPDLVKHTLLDTAQVAWLNDATEEDIITLISYIPTYDGPKDQASILFALMFGVAIPYFDLPPRYQEVKHYSNDIVWALADNLYHIESDVNNILPPYIYVSLFQQTREEKIMLSINRQNMYAGSFEYDIAIPTGVPSFALKYIYNEIARYGPIFNRPRNINSLSLPRDLGRDFVEAWKQLRQYTSGEISRGYWIDTWKNHWTDYEDLVIKCLTVYHRPPQWSIYINYGCSANRDKLNRENYPKEPIIAFGYYNDYICYRVSELFDEWERNIINRVEAHVPYWNSNLTYPGGAMLMPKTFTKNILQELWDYLQNLDVPGYEPLLELLAIFLDNNYTRLV